MDSFKKRVKDIMQNKGLKQSDLAKMTGIAEATISRYCNGRRTPNIKALVKIAKILNVSTDYLLGIKDDNGKGGRAKVRNKDRCLLEMDVIKAIDKHTREDGTLDDDISCILEEVESVDAKYTNIPSKWIPITEQTPEDESYILVSFENDTGLDIARYEEDDEGGSFYPGDDDEPYSKYGIYVNAWMPLPEPYREVTDED